MISGRFPCCLDCLRLSDTHCWLIYVEYSTVVEHSSLASQAFGAEIFAKSVQADSANALTFRAR